MKILITGRDGQVGTALTAILAPLGEIAAVGRAGADFSRPDDVAALVRRERPDVVVNATAYTNVDKAESEPELAMSVNGLSVGRMAEAATETGARLIHISTDYVFDGNKPEPYVETDPTSPVNVYGRSKLAGEQAVTAVSPDHLILRTSWVHSASHGNFVSKILEAAGQRDELKAVDDQSGCPTSARLLADVIGRVIAMGEAGRPIEGGIYHLVAGGETSRYEYARFILDEARRRGARLKAGKVVPVSSSAFPTPAPRPGNSHLSSHKLRTALGFDLPDWREDVRPTIAALVEATQ
jgi:dTDP-4-dehydrorhamnose reductase